jgi:plastocyanin
MKIEPIIFFLYIFSIFVPLLKTIYIMKKYLSLLFSIYFLSLNAQNAHTVIAVGNTFSPDTLTVNIGDTISFNIGANHNAVEVSNNTWIANGTASNGGFNIPFGGGVFIPTTVQTYYYVCQPHITMGMKGVIIAHNPIYGCTDSTALNYNSLATVDDGSCTYCVYGCTDSAATNYSVSATCDDGSCFYGIPGCTDSLACNYDSLATINDSSCIYPTSTTITLTACDSYTWLVNGVTYTTSVIDTVIGVNASGCTETNILNITINVGGCTDSLASNYDSLATCNNGSCIYPLTYTPIFFSEWAEGSSDNKYFEIYNPTADTIDLSSYAFARVNGNPTIPGVYEYWNNFDSGAVILPFDVYIVADQSADSIILNQADMAFGALSNGDDGIALVYGNQPPSPISPDSGNYAILDWIGDWNGDPGQGWSVAGVFAATRNHTLIRKCPISQGDTSWVNAAGTDPVNSQWIVLANEDWTNIGFHNTCICDSSTNSYTSITDTICNGLSIVVGNSTYDSTGVYSDTLLAFNGCDSIITTNLTVLNSSASNIINDVTICNGDSIVVGSNVYNLTGSYTDILVNSAGCDSIITTNLTVQTPTYQSFTICNGDSVVVGSSVYNSTGIYTDTIQSSIGCDSIVNTNLTTYSQFNSIFGGIPNNTIGGGSFYNGSQYLELSAYMPSELISAMVYAQDTTITTFQIRDGNGNVLDSTTVNVIPGGHRVYFNFALSSGANYQLGVDGNSTNLFRNNAGVNYPYNFGALAAITNSSAGGQYYYFFYDIEIKQSSQPRNYSICAGDSIVIGASVYNASGLYTDSLTSSIGCDSLVFTNLVVYPNSTFSNPQNICSGSVYVIGNNVYDSTGIYIDTLNTQYGCDSIVTTNLTVLSISASIGTNNQTICFGDSVSIGTSVYYYDGVYNDTLQSSNGCDSIVITTLVTTFAAYTSFNGGVIDTTTGGPGGFSTYNGQLNLDNTLRSILKSAKVYAQDTNSVTFELRDDNGIVLQDITHIVYPGEQRLNFNFLIPVGSNLHLGISTGGSGLYRNNAGNGNSIGYPYNIGPVTINSANQGSTQYYYFYYDLEIMPYATINKIYICDGDSIVVGNSIYDTTGTYLDTLVATNSCDSVIYTDLDFYQSPPLTIASVPNPPEICLGDSIILEGSAGFTYYWWSNGHVGDRLVDYPTLDTWYLLSAKDSNNCVVKEDIWVYVDTCISGINNALFNQFSIYPNPTNGLINIESDLEIEQITLYSVDGQLIETTLRRSILLKIKGIYFIKIRTEKGTIVRRIVVN